MEKIRLSAYVSRCGLSSQLDHGTWNTEDIKKRNIILFWDSFLEHTVTIFTAR